jgi:hydroxyacylglutathione hydrolase
MTIQAIATNSLGNRGYLICDGAIGIVIDVQRDYGRWMKAAKAEGVPITHVFETHMHNDYVTGGHQLARQIGATYVIPAHSGTSFKAHEVVDGVSIKAGALTITGFHTPGHTEHHMSYCVTDGNDQAIFTGGGILFGTVGRTDLVSKKQTIDLTHAQYYSAQMLGEKLADSTAVFPTHGFGSFCSSAKGSGAAESTMALEKQSNIAFTTAEDEFVQLVIAGLGPYPRYYAHMAAINQAGPEPIQQLHVREYTTTAIASWLQQKHAWVIDIRSRQRFAANHPQGVINIELGGSFATYAGWILPWHDKMLLAGDSEQSLQEAHRELARLGMEQFIDGATHDMESYLAVEHKASYPVKSFDDLKSAAKPLVVLDVRFVSDWNDAHVSSSINIPLHELIARISEVPQDEAIWVHCASGYRASIAASLLDKFGKHPIVINDDFTHAIALGLTT